MIRNQLQWLLLFVLVFALSSISGPACAPDLSQGDGGLRFCNKSADCQERLGDGFTCRLHLCQRVDKCVGENQPCQVPGAKGICAKGLTVCSGGSTVCKAVEQAKAKEDCGNQLDDNCNGEIDENPPCSCKPGESRSCFDGKAGCTLDQTTLQWSCKGVCKAGIQTCRTDQEWGPCLGIVEANAEICNGKDDDCNGQVDDKAAGDGDTCGVLNKKGPCATGQNACENGSLVCKQTVQPATEVCNNIIDDDCNGIVDDNPPCECKKGEVKVCYTGDAKTANVGECKTGKQTCTPDNKPGLCIGAITPVVEICDGKDNDCDGDVDETFPNQGKNCTDTSRKGNCAAGVFACVGGKQVCKQTVQPTTESCSADGKDEDCDGLINENPPCKCTENSTQKCGLDKGECKQGTQTCDANGSFGACVGEVKPTTEVCDGKDNNCDGVIDDGFNIGASCSVGVGECKSMGKFVCRSNAAACSATAGASAPEVCNGKDDDCNGLNDDIPPKDCYSGPQGTKDVGVCKGGKQTCSNGQPSFCIGMRTPQTEIPGNGIDEDCDGKDGVPVDACKDMTGAQTVTTGKMVGCNCATADCSPTEALALCNTGWHVCSLTEWQQRANPATTTSDRDRFIGASMKAIFAGTCPCNDTDCSGATLTSETTLCAASKNTGNANRYWPFFVGPNLSSPGDCGSRWSRWPEAQTNKLSGRFFGSRSANATSQALCLAWKDLPGNFPNGKGIMCCK